MPEFLVAIPVYNERRYLESVISEVRKYAYHVLVVDDGSTDGTTDLLTDRSDVHKAIHPENRGYGQALITAFDYATTHDFEWLITIDCDEQHEPAKIPDFVIEARSQQADIISGSRYLDLGDTHGAPPADRRKINYVITRMLNGLLGLDLTDAFCGFKAYRVDALRKLSIDIPGYAMPLQLWVQAVERGLQIREIPVRLIYNDPTRHFGGMLDNPTDRLAHYLEVLARELLAEDFANIQDPDKLIQQQLTSTDQC